MHKGGVTHGNPNTVQPEGFECSRIGVCEKVFEKLRPGMGSAKKSRKKTRCFSLVVMP